MATAFDANSTLWDEWFNLEVGGRVSWDCLKMRAVTTELGSRIYCHRKLALTILPWIWKLADIYSTRINKNSEVIFEMKHHSIWPKPSSPVHEWQWWTHIHWTLFCKCKVETLSKQVHVSLDLRPWCIQQHWITALLQYWRGQVASKWRGVWFGPQNSLHLTTLNYLHAVIAMSTSGILYR
jgi:hypothetical protein